MTEHPIPDHLMCECGHPANNHVNFGRAECDAGCSCGQFSAVMSSEKRIAALEAQVDECEKEIDHWKVQAHSYKPAWDQMKSENLTLEAQVKTLRDALKDCREPWRHIGSCDDGNDPDVDGCIVCMIDAAIAASEPK